MEIIKKFNSKLTLLFFLILFFIPGGSSFLFNGLPLVGKFESLFLIFLPLLIINCFFIFDKKRIYYLLIFLCFMKLISLSGPKLGILHKQFDSKNKNTVIKTYDSFWNHEISSTQKFNWTNKKHFQIDWLMGQKPYKENDNLKFENFEEFKKLELFIDTSFYIISSGNNFRFKDFNTKNLKNFEIKNLEKNIVLENDLDFFSKKGIFLPSGIYEIKFSNNFTDNWKLELENSLNILNYTYYFSSFWLSSVLQKVENTDYQKIKFYQFISNTTDIFFLILVSLLIYEFVVYLKRKEYLTNIICFFFTLSILYFFLRYSLLNTSIFRFFDTISLSLTYSLFLIFISYKFFLKKKNENYNYDYIKTFFSVSLIFFFTFKFFSLIGVIDFYLHRGDDWFKFQVFAREIVVDDIFPHPDKIYRPGLKYLFALEHVLFGKSSFIPKMVEVWIFYFSLTLTFKIIFSFTKNNFVSLLGVFFISIIFLGENFVNYLGKGLSSYYAYILILYLIYFFISRNISTKSIWSIFPIIILLSWLREEQIILALSLIMFIPNINKEFYQRNFLNFLYLLLKNKIVITYFVIVFFSFLSVLILHKQSYNFFDFFSHPNVGFTYKKDSSSIESVYRLISGTNQLWDFPRLYSPLLLFILFLSICNFFKKFNDFRINSGFFISNLSIYFTYIFLTNVNYNPRYCINLLFLNLIYILIYFYYLKKDKKLLSFLK